MGSVPQVPTYLLQVRYRTVEPFFQARRILSPLAPLIFRIFKRVFMSVQVKIFRTGQKCPKFIVVKIQPMWDIRIQWDPVLSARFGFLTTRIGSGPDQLYLFFLKLLPSKIVCETFILIICYLIYRLHIYLKYKMFRWVMNDLSCRNYQVVSESGLSSMNGTGSAQKWAESPNKASNS